MKKVNLVTFVFSILIFLQYILALIKERLLVLEFGVGTQLDLYYSAFKVPSLFFILVSSFISTTILVPILIKEKIKDESNFNHFLNGIFSFFSYLLVFGSIIFFIFINQIVNFLNQYLNVTDLETFIYLNKLILISQIFLGFSFFLASFLQVYEKFYSFALSTIFYNLGIIFSIYFWASEFGIKGIAFGVILGSVLHLLCQLFSIWRLKKTPKFTHKFSLQGVKSIYKTATQRTIVNFLFLFPTLFIYTLWALKISSGLATSVQLSITIISMITIIISYSNTITAIPFLSKYYYSSNLKLFFDSLIIRSKMINFFSFLAFGFISVFIYYILLLFFNSSQFSATESYTISLITIIFLIGLHSKCLIQFYIHVFYIMGKNTYSLYILAAHLIFNIFLVFIFLKILSINFLNIYLLNLFNLADPNLILVLAFPLSYSISMFIVLKVYLIILNKIYFEFDKKISSENPKLILAVIIGCLLSFLIKGLFTNLIYLIFISGFAGVTLTFYLLYILKHKEFCLILKYLENKKDQYVRN